MAAVMIGIDPHKGRTPRSASTRERSRSARFGSGPGGSGCCSW